MSVDDTAARVLLAEAVEGRIEDLSGHCRGREVIRAAVRALRAYWGVAGPCPRDGDEEEDGDPDENSTHYVLCRRLVGAFQAIGFDPLTDDGEGYLDAAARDLADYLDGDLDDDDATVGGSERFHDRSGLEVNLLLGTVTYLPPPVTLRVPPKVGRNSPCPCGSGAKHKNCCLGGGGSAA